METVNDIDQSIAVIMERGLIVFEGNEDGAYYVARPSSVCGTKFPNFEDEIVGLGNAFFQTNAPLATLIRGQAEGAWIADISVGAAPGPGPIYFNETFDSFMNAAAAVVDCYFGNRIDFNNESLRSWGLAEDGKSHPNFRYAALLESERVEGEKCKKEECNQLRIFNSVFCPRHHYEMVYKEPPTAG